MTRFHSRSLLITGVLVGLFLLASRGASAHAKLASSNPAAGSTLPTAPATVSLVFTNHDALAADGSTVTVVDANGVAVDTGDSRLDTGDAERKTLVVSLNERLPDGVYTVKWTAVSSADGSSESGEFQFGVGAATVLLPATGTPSGLTVGWMISGALVLCGIGVLLRRNGRPSRSI